MHIFQVVYHYTSTIRSENERVRVNVEQMPEGKHKLVFSDISIPLHIDGTKVTIYPSGAEGDLDAVNFIHGNKEALSPLGAAKERKVPIEIWGADGELIISFRRTRLTRDLFSETALECHDKPPIAVSGLGRLEKIG